jgi:hypothetical protein
VICSPSHRGIKVTEEEALDAVRGFVSECLSRRAARARGFQPYSVLIGGLLLFSSPGLVAGAGKLGLFSVTVGSPAGGLLGTLAFDPDGRADSPLDDGSGVSANADALTTIMAAIKLGITLDIFLSPSRTS